MRFPNGVTHAHQWVKNGDHPADNSEMTPVEVNDGVVTGGTLTPGEVVQPWDDATDATIDKDCGSPWRNHGLLGGTEMVCPGDWIATTSEGYERYPNDPVADVFITHEVDNEVVRQVGEETYNYTVDWYADCRTHTMRRKFNNREERDTYAETHAIEEQHIVDRYEVIR